MATNNQKVITLENLATFKAKLDTTYQTVLTIDDTLSSSSANPVQNNVITTKINQVEALAQGTSSAIAFTNYSTLVSDINSYASNRLKLGQSIYINTQDVPDLWVYGVEESSSTYVYTNDNAFVNALKNNGYVQVGYYLLAPLETLKVDLSNYVTSDTLTSTLASYVTSSNLTSILNGYVSSSSLATTLASYATNSDITDTLANYVTTSSLNTTLTGYVTNANLSTTLGDYVTKGTNQSISGQKTFIATQTFNAGITTQNVVPSTTETYNVGASDKVYTNAYTKNISDGTNSISVADIVNKQDAITFATDLEINALFENSGGQGV